MTMMSSESIIDRRALLAGVAALPALGGALLPASAQAQVAAVMPWRCASFCAT